MQIRVNDEPVELTEQASLAELLTQLAQQPNGIAMAVNQTIVPRTAWASHRLNEGDSVALFQAIAGG